jgi:glutaminase
MWAPLLCKAKWGQPKGVAFNSVMALELHGGKPQSPLVNAGAMSCGQLNLAEMTMEGLYDSSGDWAYSPEFDTYNRNPLIYMDRV